VGLIWEPLKEMSVTFDRFDIRRRQEINVLDLDLILANEGATTGVYANRVIRGPVLPGEQFGPIQAISSFFFNSGKTEIKGYDLEGRYRHSFGEMGRVTFAAAATYLKSVRGNSVDTEPVLEFVTYGAPRTRARGELTWEYRDYTFGTAVNYNSGYNVLRDPTLTCSAAIRAVQPDCYVDPSTTTDVSVRWTGIKNLTLSMIVRNVANRKPVLDANARPLNFTFHPFQGQYMTVAATYRFK
jgi:iron complex outermembrane receptor protein